MTQSFKGWHRWGFEPMRRHQSDPHAHHLIHSATASCFSHASLSYTSQVLRHLARLDTSPSYPTHTLNLLIKGRRRLKYSIFRPGHGFFVFCSLVTLNALPIFCEDDIVRTRLLHSLNHMCLKVLTGLLNAPRAPRHMLLLLLVVLMILKPFFTFFSAFLSAFTVLTTIWQQCGQAAT